MGVLIIDIDYFKGINDRYGYNTGDSLLIKLSEIIKANLNTSDIIGRFSGNAFIIARPNSTESGIKTMAKELAFTVTNTSFADIGVDQPVKLSVGYSFMDMYEYDQTKITRLAENAMYLAKQNGRNCVCSYKDKPLGHQHQTVANDPLL
jgi:polar amino acid transport system substrate-binding protein